MSRALRIGLTGGIGSGKSTVAGLLRARGAHIVDTDAIAHRLTAPGGRAIAAIAAAFGPESIDAQGAMDRARMRERVFADPAERQRLEAILHPLIAQDTEAEAAAAPPGAPVVFDVPLLVESGRRWRERSCGSRPSSPRSSAPTITVNDSCICWPTAWAPTCCATGFRR